jgi:hypothetical protein
MSSSIDFPTIHSHTRAGKMWSSTNVVETKLMANDEKGCGGGFKSVRAAAINMRFMRDVKVNIQHYLMSI